MEDEVKLVIYNQSLMQIVENEKILKQQREYE